MHLTNVKFQKRIEDHLSGRIDRPDFILYVNALIQFTLTLILRRHPVNITDPVCGSNL